MMQQIVPNLLAAAVDGGGAHAANSGAIRGPANPLESFIRDGLIVVVDIGVVAIAMAIVFCLLRMLKGPTLVDRSIAADTVAMQVVALVILLTVRLGTLQFFDAVLIVSFLGFISTLAFAQFIGRRRSAQ